MFHFPHRLQSVEKPTATTAVGGLVYNQVTNNARCQFLGRPREGQQNGTFGEERVVDVVFSLPPIVPVEVGWRLVYNNQGYIVEEVEPEMDLTGGHVVAQTVYTRRERQLDGATSYTSTT